MSSGKQRKAKPKPDSDRSLKPLALLFGFLAILAVLSAILPLIQSPSVRTPSSASDENPFALPVELTSESLFPIYGFKASCELGEVSERNGQPGQNESASQPYERSVLYSKNKMTIQCDRAF